MYLCVKAKNLFLYKCVCVCNEMVNIVFKELLNFALELQKPGLFCLCCAQHYLLHSLPQLINI